MQPSRRARGLSAGAAAAILGFAFGDLTSERAQADEFFATRDQNPLLRGFYLPLPSDSPRDADAVMSATLLVSNTLNVEMRGRESLLVDGESAALELTYENSWRYTRLRRHFGRGPTETELSWKRVLPSPTSQASPCRSRRCGWTARERARC